MAAELWLRRHLLRTSGGARYRLLGTCNGCGRCCETPSVYVGRWTWRLLPLRAVAVWWQRTVNGFELVGDDPRFKMLIFRCTHYVRETRQCDSYDSRPLMCRDYPANLTYEAVPTLFDECSHRIVDKNAVGLLAALADSGLPPEKLNQLKQKLFLDVDGPTSEHTSTRNSTSPRN